jgi:membrane carboxypeptidase/penicillin-binding protein
MFPLLALRVWSFVKAHPRFFVIPLALAVAYFAGYYSRPAKVITHEITKTQIQYQDRVVEKAAKERVVYRDIIRTVVVTKQPNGATTTTTTVADHSRDHTDTRVDTTKTEAGTTKSEVTRTTITDRTTSWAVQVLAGAEFRPAPQWQVGAAFQYRIPKTPLTAGAYGLVATDGKSGAVGVSVGGVF